MLLVDDSGKKGIDLHVVWKISDRLINFHIKYMIPTFSYVHEAYIDYDIYRKQFSKCNTKELKMNRQPNEQTYLPGADPGIYVSGGALDRRGVWGPLRSPAGPGQRPVGGPGGRSPLEAHEN